MVMELEHTVPDKIVRRGQNHDYQWIVYNHSRGYRCGFIRVHRLHPWYGLSHNRINAEIVSRSPVRHHLLSYSGHGVNSVYGGADNRYWWVGFHCDQHGDARDVSILGLNYAVSTIPTNRRYRGLIRDEGYVAMECRRLCEEAAFAELLHGANTAEQKARIQAQLP